jgi:hypothetical protein
MTKFHRATAAIIGITATVGLGGCAQPTTTTATPASCSEAVKQAWDNVALRIQHEVGNTSRESAKVHLHLAQQAADNNDDKECWRQYNWSKYLVR